MPAAAPRSVHQFAVLHLYDALKAVVGADLRVLVAPLDVVLADDTVLQPDVLVARRADIADAGLSAPPVLVVEVLSPSALLMGLEGDEYVEIGRASGDEPLRLRVPAELTVVPAQLVR